MDAIQQLIVDLEASKISSSQQPVVVPIADFIAALNEIEGAIGPGAVSSVTNTDGSITISPTTGAVVVNTNVSGMLSVIGAFTSLVNGFVPASGGGTSNFLRADGTWDIPPGTGGVTFANPTATAGPAAVNGVATTAMRSDAAPAIQKASSSQFGIVEVDNTTITASAGVISAAAGASPPSEVLISRVTPSGTGVVTFSSLGTFTDLRIVIYGASSAAASSAAVDLTFNGDTGANYDWQLAQGTGSGATGVGAVAANLIQAATVPGNTAPANCACQANIYIPDYRGTTFQKSLTSTANFKNGTATTSNLFAVLTAGWWRNTAAITSITLTLSAGNWVSGTQVALFGIN